MTHNPLQALELKRGWLSNPAWERDEARAAGLVHGTLLRGATPTAGKPPLAESLREAGEDFRALLSQAGGAENGDCRNRLLIGADQVHGDRIALVHETETLKHAAELVANDVNFDKVYEFPGTDALATGLRNAMLLIQTADCLPILFWAPKAGWIAACHCGWRGLLAGLAGRSAQTLARLGADPSAVEAWIGPGIRAGHYEVGKDLARRFARAFPETEVSPDGRHLDLARIAGAQLRAAGLAPENIADSGEDTFADAERYHSYRRDGERAGRLLTVIGFTR